jgi:corrinoid protein of di/trimethylamine methyltransferase
MTDTNDDTLDFSALSLEDLYEQMGDDLYDGLEEEVVAAVNEALSRGRDAYEVLTEGLVAGMDIVGNDFRDGILFVPEVLMAAKAMKAGMAILRPLLAESGAPQQGTLVIGTVKGDIHDIGQNLVAMMMEGAGFEVHNLGINVNADKYMAAIREHSPDILGMSALLTTTMPYMKVVVDRLKEEGIRDDIIVMVGGAPVTQDFADHVGADGYGEDAAQAVEVARRLMAKRREQGTS